MNPGEAYISLADYGLQLAKPEPIVRSQAHSFTPLLSTFAGDRWRKGSEGIFTQVWTSGENPQGEAGYKIRLAAYPGIADEVLCAVVPIIVEAGCPFKVIANTVLLELACSKWSSEDPAGDFMTVYPPTQALFDDLTEKLKHALRGIKDAPVLAPSAETSGRTALTPDNPWPGLDYFLPADSSYFFGRDNEQLELEQRLERALVTVVLGEPGVGKSSLLRAGLKPLFDRKGLEPVYLRLQCAGAVHPVQQVRDEINRVLIERKINGAPFGEGQTLRDYFQVQKPGWVAGDQKHLVPVLIFDQFEDVLACEGNDPAARNHVEALWTQIASLVDNRSRESGGQHHRAAPDSRSEGNGFKVVISLRQGYLPKLLSRRGQMPSVTQNHFPLKPLNGWQAAQAVLEPGKRLLGSANPETLAEEIVRGIGRGRPQSSERPIADGEAIESLESLRVEPPLLSFFCQQLNEARKRSREGDAGASLITAELVKAEAERILADFRERSEKAETAPPATEPINTVQAAEPTSTAPTEPQPTVPATLPLTATQTAQPQTTVPATQPQTTVQTAQPIAAVQAAQPLTVVQATQPIVAVHRESRGLEEEKRPVPKFEGPGKAPLPAQGGDFEAKRLKNLAYGLVILLIIIFTVMVVTYVEELQQAQTEVELENFISNLAAAKNTLKSAHKALTIEESNLALKESNLLVLTEQTREQELETQAAKDQYSKLADEQTNYQSRINELNAQKTKAESRLAEWSSLLYDLTNQIANLATQKEELEARNHALTVTNHALAATNRAFAATNHAPAVANDASVVHLSLNRPGNSNATDDRQAAAMESPPEKLSAAVIPNVESSSRRNANVLLTHGQCLYSVDGTNFRPLEIHQVLRQGITLQTAKRSWCDFFIRRAGVTVRMAPESEMKIAKLSLTSENGVPIVDTLLELPYGRIFTVVRALIPGSSLQVVDAGGRSVIEGGGLGSYMITAPKPDYGDKLTVIPLRVIGQQGTGIIAPGQEYSAKDGTTFSLSPSTWETTFIHLDELEAEADKAIADPGPPKSPKTN
jgi:hypothetical protein